MSRAARILATIFGLVSAALGQSPAASEPAKLVPKSWLVIGATEIQARRPIRPDLVFAQHVLALDAAPPRAGETLTGENGKTQTWTAMESADGTIGEDFGCAYAQVEAPKDGVWIAVLSGASTLFVNGVGFVGDVYGYGFGGVPVALKKGANQIFVRGPRGKAKLEFVEPASSVMLGAWNIVKPDLVAGRVEDGDSAAAILLVNASSEKSSPLELALTSDDDFFTEQRFQVGPMPPLSLRMQWFTLLRKVHTADALAHEKPGVKNVALALGAHGVSPIATTKFGVELKDEHAARRVTFDSLIEGSIQSFSMLPASGLGQHDYQIVLSLHGAGVDAQGQAQSYSAKPGMTIVAPTNRRPYGFDWQDWGRDDAYEVLAFALKLTRADPNRVFLTGHSMGGHGTWNLGANDPWRFVAIAPSAGWASFDTYGHARPDSELSSWWKSADAASRTEDLVANLVSEPTFILHGTADDNVPIDEAKAMEKRIVDAGGKPIVHYQEGAGHWWDGPAAPGADCVDWPGIFEMFGATPARKFPAKFDFTCADPSINAKFGPIALDQPIAYGKPMRIVGTYDAEKLALCIETTNVRRIRVRQQQVNATWRGLESVTLDGELHDLRAGSGMQPVGFVRAEESWTAYTDSTSSGPVGGSVPSGGNCTVPPTPPPAGSALPSIYDAEKNFATSGPFKRVFHRHFALVYGTSGTPDENRELFERARYDQTVWWYRANGTPTLISDVDFLADEARKERPVRNAILYGNSTTNKAWSKLVANDAPIRVKRGSIEFGQSKWAGDDFCALFLLPRADLKTDSVPYLRDPKLDPSELDDSPAWPLVGVIADTGVKGIRLGYDLAPFVSGVGYPDYTIFSSAVLEKGDSGVLATGWFDAKWKPQAGGFLREAPSAKK